MIELRQRTTARNGYHRINSDEDFQSIPRLNINEKKKILVNSNSTGTGMVLIL